jgi:1-acyl-sn-glycerol-3-phosphate acyltransferase
MTWYRFFQLLVTPFAYGVARLEVVGKENVPRTGPFILVANHQSVLDPILVQVVCPRPLHTLTKSTQFGGGVMRWVMPRLNAIPTRRYRVDPQAVRVVLRRLARGKAWAYIRRENVRGTRGCSPSAGGRSGSSSRLVFPSFRVG